MNIYITKNGEKIGPYSLPVVQSMFDAGKLLFNDLAWYEEQPGWIPLHEVPGFFHRPTVLRQHTYVPPVSAIRPAPVWIICLLLFIFAPLILLGKGMVLYSTVFGIVSEPGVHVHFADDPSSPTYRDHLIIPLMISILGDFLSLTGAFFLFMLRKPALYFFVAAFVIWLLNCALIGLFDSWAGFVGTSLDMLFSFAINLVILWYISCLIKKGVLT